MTNFKVLEHVPNILKTKKMLKIVKTLFLSLFIIGFISCSEEETSIDEPETEITDESSDDGTDVPKDEETDNPTDETEDPTDDPEDETEDPDAPSTVSGSVVDIYGQLSINGNKIVDKNNEAIQLRGMSLFWSQWSEGAVFYNAETVNWLKEDWNSTIVRAAMGVDESLGYISNPDTEKAKVFAVIDAAIAEGIYVIVDWHSHHAENYLEQSKAFFTEVAQKYGDHPNIIYEIYNEPLNVSWSQVLKPYHEAVIAQIRKYDSDNIIVCGTRNWSQAVSEVIGNEIDDDNVAYTLHYYSTTHLAEDNAYVYSEAVKAINAGIPLFVTEYGVTSADGNGSINKAQAEKWWDFLDQNQISWCNWSIANKNEASAALQPGTSTNNLSVDNLTTSGKMVYDEMIAKNQDFE